MGSWHGVEIDRVAVLILLGPSVSLIIPEAVLDSDDDPTTTVSNRWCDRTTSALTINW